MEQNIVVLQGKVFTIDIQSMFGSTNYGWCLTSLPAEINLMAADNMASDAMGPVTQRFYFGAVSSTAVNVDIHFALTCWADLTKVAETFTAHVSIISGESVNYTPYSENAAFKYGYPCDEAAKAIMPYGVFNSDAAVGTPFYKNNAAVGTPFYKNSAAVNTPFYANNTAVNTPFYANNTAANTPFYANNAAVGTPFYKNSAALNTPFYANNTAVNTPFYANNTAVNTPFYANDAAVNTPFYANDAAVNTPFYANNAAVNTPFYANNAAVGTPFYRNGTAVNTPFYNGTHPLVAYGYPSCWGCC